MGLVDLLTGGGLTWAWDQSGYDEAACLSKANAQPLVAALDAKTHDLSTNWHPTGYYAVKDITTIVGSIITASAAAKAAVTQAPRSTRDAEESIGQAVSYLDTNVERSKPYIDAANEAAKGKGIVDAPAFKTWVTNSLNNISQAYVTLGMLSCAESWFQHGLAVADDIINKCKAAVVVGLEYAKDAVKASFGFLEFITSKPFRYTTTAVGVVLLSVFAYFKVKPWVQRVRLQLKPGSTSKAEE